MKYARIARYVLPFLVLTASCAGDQDDRETKALAKLSPVSVSANGAWSLFDRSTASGFTPTGDPVTVKLARPELLDVVKVHGPAPYRLQVRGANGSDLGFETIDLSSLAPGWHAFASTNPARSAQVELAFTPTTKAAGTVPELELWTSDAGDDNPRSDLLVDNLPSRYVPFPSSGAAVQLAAGECKEFPVTIDRPTALFSRAYLAYRAAGTFRSFGLEYSINTTASSGAAWLAGDGQPHSFTDQIDPGTINSGPNTVRMCVPTDATDHVDISDVRLVGELDRGTELVSAVRIGTSSRPGDKAIDGVPSSSISVAAHEELMLQLERLVAPDALLLKGSALSESMHADCLDRAGHRTALHPVAFLGGQILDGGAISCAALAIQFDEPVDISELRVVGSGTAERIDWPKFVITSAAEHFGTTAWIGGYTVRPSAEGGAISIDVAKEHRVSAVGRFGMLIHRDEQHATAAWPVEVRARYPDGTTETRVIELDKNAANDLAAAHALSPATTAHDNEVHYSTPDKQIVVKASPAKLTSIRLGTLIGADVPAGAVTHPTDITVRHLPTSGLPPLDGGMINVTAPRGHGYEFLPHGQHFAKPIDALVPFDPSLIPSTRTSDDVRTYYYDTASKHWKQLTRTALDVKDNVVHNATDHFTIMINAVLAVPTTPTPLSFDPTSLSGIPAASPAAGIDLIEPPTASSTGDAHLSYPIRIPAGRGAYSPSVGLKYSSSNQNGWLGVGWDVPVSRIDIDTKWGVPTYADGEEPRYLLDGAQLVPTLDTDGPVCSSGPTGRRYHTRAEGAFAHILRCGADPSAYWWEIYDRNGTKYVYGGTTSANTGGSSFLSTKPRPATCSGTCPPGVFRWFVHTVTDTHNNTTTYSYLIDNIATTEPGRDVLPSLISYSSSQYSVVFTVDGNSRTDTVISGRGGFKQQTRRLLHSIKVKYGSSVIREYVFTYTRGMFEKSTLTMIQHFGESGCTSLGTNAFVAPTCTGALDQHTFTYVSDPNSALESFGSPLAWTGMQADGAGVNSGYDTTVSGSLSLSDPTDSATIGVNGSWGSRTNTTGMFDFNGDGLADQLVYTATGNGAGNPPVPVLNQGEIAGGGSGTFAVTTQGSPPLPAIGFENHGSWGVDARVGIRQDGFGVGISGGFTDATSRAKKEVADADGDGYVDYIDAAAQTGKEVSLGAFCNSSPPGQCFTQNPFSVLAAINPGSDPLLTNYNNEIKQRAIPAAPVAEWVPPYTGYVNLNVSAQLLQNTTGDGVTVTVYQGDTQQGTPGTLTSSASPWTFNNANLFVTAGVPIYVVLRTGASDGSTSTALNEKVTALINASYTSAWWNAANPSLVPFSSEPGALTPTNASVVSYDMQNDSRVVATRPLTLSAKGTMTFNFKLTKSTSAADIRWCLQRFDSSAGSTDLPCDSSQAPAPLTGGTIAQATPLTTYSYSLPNISVSPGDRLVLRAEGIRTNTSNPVPIQYYSIDPQTITFSAQGTPGFVYTQACEPGSTGSCTMSTDPDLLDEVKPNLSSFGVFLAAVSPPSPAGAVPLTHKRLYSEPYTVHSFTNPYGASTPIYIALRSNVRGTDAPTYCASGTCTYPNIPGGYAGEWLSFEIIGNPPGGTFPLNPMYIQIQTGAIVENVPVVYRSSITPTAPPSPFVGGYRNWFFSFWNERKAFVPDELYATYADTSDSQLAVWCSTQSFCQTNCAGLSAPQLQRCERADLATTALAPLPAFGGTPLAGSANTWIADGGDAFINNTTAYAADVGGGGFGAGSVPDGGLFENQYLRLSGTQSHYIGADVSLRTVPGLPGGLSGSVTQSETNTTTDLVDVNGDGVLDAIAGNGTWVGHITTSPAPQIMGLQFNDPTDPYHPGFRRRTGFDYSVSQNGLASIPSITSGGRTLMELIGQVSPDSAGVSSSSGLGFGRAQETQDLVDINGDGLPDLVSRSGTTITVRYNFGNSLGAPETFGTVDATMNTAIDGFQSVETSKSLDSTANALSHETTLTEHDTTTLDLILVKLTKTSNTASVRTTRMLVDLNGDGLPDLVRKTSGQPIKVQFNRGSTFGPTKTWNEAAWVDPQTSLNLLPSATSGFAAAFASLLSGSQSVADIDVLAGSTRSASTTRSAGVSIPIPGVANVGLTFAYQRSYDNYELALMDVNGDGAADHVLRKASDPRLWVKVNNVRANANLLTSVHRPLGGTITLTYADAGNTTDMPHRREVLSHVDVDDGVDMGANYASPTLFTNFSYQNGYYSRLEKQFLGFGKVITTFAANGGSVEQTFENHNIRTAGDLLEEVRKDAGNNVLSDHVITYETLVVKDSTNTAVAFHPSCTAALPDLLKREPAGDPCTPQFVFAYQDTTTRYEAGVGKTRTISNGTPDQFGNELYSVDSVDDAVFNDDNVSIATYNNYVSATTWILGRPSAITLYDGSASVVQRSRTGTYDSTTGDLKTISVPTSTYSTTTCVASGSSTATTTFGYDTYGNLNQVTTPPNSSGVSQTYNITFDPTVHTYPTLIVNGFGEQSTATYDLRYGFATLQTDVSGNSLTRTLDTYGRLVSVTGPYDLSGPGITMEYHPEATQPMAITVTHPSAPSDYTGTLPSAITTVTFMDGLGRPIELRKTSNVGGVAGMTTSGLVSRDTLGRVIASYQPSFLAGASTAFITPAANYATTMQYDALDRTTKTIFPDGNAISTSFDTGAYNGFTTLFRTTVTDPNFHTRETYTDIAGRTRAFTEHPTATSTSLTTYDYTPAGDLSKIVDADNNTPTTLSYDLRGLRTKLVSPDTGTVNDAYDSMGNHVCHADANHAAHSTSVTYGYDHDRLNSVIYPSGGKPPVTYSYANGRLQSVTDETGSQTFTYGALGEKRRVLRTITRLDSSTATFDTHFTTDSLGRQLQVIYPDGTTISNTYDEGGALSQVTGTGSGWSKTYADQIQYDVFGNRTHMRFGNNVATTWSYEPQRVRLSTVTTTLPSGPNVQQLVYGYDPASNPTSISNNVPALTAQSGMRPGPSSLTLSYDWVDQLTNVNAPTGWVDASNSTTYTETFTYSPSHKLSTKTRTHKIGTQVQNGTSFTSTYNYAPGGPPHLPSSISSTSPLADTLTITYDPNGNPIERDHSGTGSHQTLTWDDDNRLSTITSTYTLTNKYDAFGVRALRDGGDQHTLFANQYFDLEGTAGGTEYVFAGATRVAAVLGGFTGGANPVPPSTPGTAYYLHPDSLGSTAVVTTEAGDAQESHDYFVDGELWIDHASQMPVNGYLFEGKPYDKLTGFYDYGQRFYDPRTSLWLGEDAAYTESPGKAVGNPMILSVSAFSAQSPARFIDPDGRQVGGYSGMDLGGAASSFPDPFSLAGHQFYQVATDPDTWKEVGIQFAAFVVPYGDAANRARNGDYKGAVKSAAIQTALLGMHLVDPEPTPGASPYEPGSEPQLPSTPENFSPDPWNPSDAPRYYRGAKAGQAPDFTPRPGQDFRVDKVTGTVKPTHGVSVYDNPQSVQSKGWEPHEVDQSTVPDTLQIKHRSATDPHHFEIMPREGANLTPAQFTTACQSILCK